MFVDPLLSPLANNGGPTQTMALRAGSPAIDAGGSSCPATDQRGLVRVGACDIGAYEFSAPLPVELTAFSVTASAGVAQLRWRTASETANAGFAVEVSSDGRQFRRLGWVAGQGSRAHPTDYTFADPALASYAGPLVYYRLQQVDEGGTGRFSPVRSVPVSGALGLQLWPNPARQRVSVGGVGAGQAVRVYDLSGRLVLAATVPVSGPSELELPAGLPRGSYLVRAGVRAARLVLE
ncbi:T9SS type A sorting domain-containing protein [Hymenobacter montanus]|uniref:T9SS type A sorting domain-containing protein n=1 Tax=Hymenobacter montanus TaxID=2771359 RepID=UPI001CC2D6FD|nr:T9SS type A sorting domain-containing protein [Hymenobacter montanus]